MASESLTGVTAFLPLHAAQRGQGQRFASDVPTHRVPGHRVLRAPPGPTTCPRPTRSGLRLLGSGQGVWHLPAPQAGVHPSAPPPRPSPSGFFTIASHWSPYRFQVPARCLPQPLPFGTEPLEPRLSLREGFRGGGSAAPRLLPASGMFLSRGETFPATTPLTCSLPSCSPCSPRPPKDG